MTSGWRAAVVANTCLSNPAMTSHALDFYAQRERDIYAECQRARARFFSDAAAFHRTPFWVRAQAHRLRRTERRLVDLSAAHDRLARRDSRQAAPVGGAPVRRRRRTSKGAKSCSAMRSCPRAPTVPLRFAAGVNLPALVRLADRLRRRAGDLFCLSRARRVRRQSTICSPDCRCSSRATRSFSRMLADETCCSSAVDRSSCARRPAARRAAAAAVVASGAADGRGKNPTKASRSRAIVVKRKCSAVTMPTTRAA